LHSSADEYLLFFWADAARLPVRPLDQLTFAEHQFIDTNEQKLRSTVHNAAGVFVGTACPLKGEHWAQATGGFNGQWYDFIAVGKRAVPSEYPATMIALQIEWVGSIGYRVDIAEIGEEVWTATGPMRRLVALA
jgi:hypothetical protein